MTRGRAPVTIIDSVARNDAPHVPLTVIVRDGTGCVSRFIVEKFELEDKKKKHLAPRLLLFSAPDTHGMAVHDPVEVWKGGSGTRRI